ncbi:MAG: hypothetical protein ACPG8W_16225 [Candidatus Promineifilaceae bacterium]
MTDSDSLNRWLAPLGIALTFVAYFMVWMPNQAAALSIIGQEIGEWVKFLPEVRAGQVGLGRNWFYAPPLTLAALTLLWTRNWPARWQSWVMRAAAFVLCWPAFPVITLILNEARSEWLLRVTLVLATGVLAVFAGQFAKLSSQVVWGLGMGLAVLGGVMPLLAYLAHRPIIAAYLNAPLGIGIGVWTNLLGHSLIAGALWHARRAQSTA